ncbi:alpha/beta hydrolase-fold protein [Flavobacteriaceae bacterium S356]|uniref:Alpha/beta hydrolase-fold protein n=1 Tax=Asprobacillus argus TaxID=3076534 RepID=A0ABU3LHX8_9FLAO|nr:alpha/beta hydrolase-fold protein [Flavobacteriaceae bacterium S356]
MTSLKSFSIWIIALSTTLIFAKNNGKIVQQEVSGHQLSIYIPHEYSSAKKYKVIYINDGQWLFKRSESLQLDKKLDSLIAMNAIEPIIIVGIHSDRSRTENYVPYKIEGNPYFVSKAASYANTLTKEIIPFIDTRYSTIKKREGRAVFGFSFGGLNATWLAIHYPNSFSFSAGFSPSFWVNNHQIIKEVHTLKENTTFWFDIGTNEWNYYVPFIDLAIKQGGVYGKSIFYYEIPKGEHTIDHWKKRLPYPILVFAGKKAGKIEDWNIEIEVIKSTSRKGVFYQRINPIVTLTNGVKYSLADQATYILKNKKDGKLAADGRFAFDGQNDLSIVVSYKGFKEEIIIKYLDIQKLKKQ